jgi:hypothetical protein
MKLNFVVEKNRLTQVFRQINEPREFENLMAITENFPKYVITLNDTLIGQNYKGIIQMNLLEFLLTTEL